jgi:hypothetical protein
MTRRRSPFPRSTRPPTTRRTSSSRQLLTIVLTGLLLVGTVPAGAAPTSTASTASTARATTTPVASKTPTRTIVLRPAAKRMPETWKRSFVIPYGDGRKQLGTGLEGDGEGLRVGPNYGAQAPDGSWWFLDTHKYRLARYSSKGTFRQELRIPPKHLAGGQYFPHQLPRVLNDGTFLAGHVVDGGTNLLRAKNGRIDTVRLNREAVFRTDDGRKLYGFDWDGPMVEANVKTGKVRDTNWFRTRSGERYRVTLTDGKLRVVLPDAKRPVDRTWKLTNDRGKPIQAQVQVASGTDGKLHLFLTGFEDRPGAPDLAGYTTISAKGKLGPIERVLSPFGESDPGSPSQLGVRPKSSTPWLMFIREDGVHVYQRRTGDR